MTRRAAVTALAGICGYLYGTPVGAAQGPRGMALALDGVEGIVITYRGQRVVVTPQDIVDALARKGAGDD